MVGRILRFIWRRPVVFILGLALFVNLGAGVAFGLFKPLVSDSEYYLHIAENLATGKGYVLDAAHSFWPDEPSMRRLPLWPVTIAALLKICPGADPNALARALCLLFNAGAAAAVAWLALGLGRRLQIPNHGEEAGSADEGGGSRSGLASAVPVLIAGLLYTFHPGMLHLALQGLSEPLFVFLVTLGMALVLAPGSRRPKSTSAGDRGIRTIDLRVPASGLLLGLACLVRANFVLFPIFFATIVAAWGMVQGALNIRLRLRLRRDYGRTRRKQRSEIGSQSPAVCGLRSVVYCLLLAALFYLPISSWITRNYRVCGHPVISTLRGQTIYGGNNEVVAEDLNWWGYWVFPNSIPGETPMHELAKAMSEYEVDHYYTQKAVAYLKGHWFSYPRLLLGKLTRAYVPIPWKASMGSYAVSGYRWLIYLLLLVGLARVAASSFAQKAAQDKRRQEASELPELRPPTSDLRLPLPVLWAALILTNVAAVLIFWGNARFALSLEPLLLPVAAMAFLQRRGLQGI